MTSTKSYTATSLVAYMLGSLISGTWNDETIHRLYQLGEEFWLQISKLAE